MTWLPLLHIDDIPNNDVAAAMSDDGREFALYKIEGEVFASAAFCTHGKARLCDGFFENGAIECPLHQGRFDIKTGKALCAPLIENLKTYAVKIEEGMVSVEAD